MFRDFFESLNVESVKVCPRKKSSFWKKYSDNVFVKEYFAPIDNNIGNCVPITRDTFSLMQDDEEKIVHILIWGYPNKRERKGKHAPNLYAVVEFVKRNIIPIKCKSITEEQYLCLVGNFKSTGFPPGALSKFLYFFNISDAVGHTLVIVDMFVEEGIKFFNQFQDCDSYFKISSKINEIAKECDVAIEKVEYFLFFIGKCALYNEQPFNNFLKYIIDK